MRKTLGFILSTTNKQASKQTNRKVFQTKVNIPSRWFQLRDTRLFYHAQVEKYKTALTLNQEQESHNDLNDCGKTLRQKSLTIYVEKLRRI
jgi:hypothetical protein